MRGHADRQRHDANFSCLHSLPLSLPHLAMAKQVPNILAKSTRTLMRCWRSTPLRKALISGIPPPDGVSEKGVRGERVSACATRKKQEKE